MQGWPTICVSAAYLFLFWLWMVYSRYYRRAYEKQLTTEFWIEKLGLEDWARLVDYYCKHDPIDQLTGAIIGIHLEIILATLENGQIDLCHFGNPYYLVLYVFFGTQALLQLAIYHKWDVESYMDSLTITMSFGVLCVLIQSTGGGLIDVNYAKFQGISLENLDKNFFTRILWMILGSEVPHSLDKGNLGKNGIIMSAVFVVMLSLTWCVQSMLTDLRTHSSQEYQVILLALVIIHSFQRTLKLISKDFVSRKIKNIGLQES